MKRLEIVKRAKLAGLRGDLPSAFLTQELAALAEAAGPLFKHLPEDLLRTQFDVATCVALAQTCKHLRVICGLVLDWLPQGDEARRLLNEFVRASRCTAPQLRDSLCPILPMLRLARQGNVFTHGRLNGHMKEKEPAGRKMMTPTITGSFIEGTIAPRRTIGPQPLPCCFGVGPLPVDKPTRWVARRICPGNGNSFGVGVVGVNGSRKMSVLWLYGSQLRIGRRVGTWLSTPQGLGPDFVLPREETKKDEDPDASEEEEPQEQDSSGEEDSLDDRDDFAWGYMSRVDSTECVGLEYDPLHGSLTMVHPRLGKSYRGQSNLLVAADQVAAAAATSSSPSTTPAGWRWHVSVETFRGGGCSVDRLLA